MDWLLMHLADIYRYSTGFLIAWGIFASHTIFQILLYSHEQRGSVRKGDAWYFIAILTSTVFFTSTLFVCDPAFTSKYMIALFMFEIWYTMFAAYFTYIYVKPCITEYARLKLTAPHRTPKLHP